VLISKYGFRDVLIPGQVIVDPSRVAAQIVSGIVFLGAGLIFVRRNSVRGLTTAAPVWVTAAIGPGLGRGHIVRLSSRCHEHIMASLQCTLEEAAMILSL
jgi:putative Mg2+ transporter-C (MgtC) family protein